MVSDSLTLPAEVESCQSFTANQDIGFDSQPWKRPHPVLVFQVTLSGEGQLNYAGKEWPQLPGQGFLIHTAKPHRYWLPARSSAWCFISFTFRGRALLDWQEGFELEHGCVFELPEDSDCVQQMRRLYLRVSREVMVDPYSLSAQTYQLAMHLQQHVQQKGRPGSTDVHVEQVLRIMRRDYRKALSLENLAQACGLSSFYLSRLFKQHTGTTLRAYLEQIRIQQAKHLLLDRAKTVAEVAACVGFSDQAYFANVFRKRVGLSPSSYRDSVALPWGD